MSEYYEEDNPYKVLERIFSLYNTDTGETKNPLLYPKEHEFVIKNKTHTSMSIGDVVQINEQFYVCEDEGWRELK